MTRLGVIGQPLKIFASPADNSFEHALWCATEALDFNNLNWVLLKLRREIQYPTHRRQGCQQRFGSLAL